MIDTSEVQSTILRPSGAQRLDLVFLTVCCRRRMRELVLAAHHEVTVTSVAEERLLEGDHHALNLGISAEGVRLAGVESRAHDALPSAFARGMGDASDRLQDVGDSAPENWEWPFHGGDPRVHVVVLRYDDAPLGTLQPFVDGTAGSCEHPGPPADERGGPVASWTGQVHPRREEPFGFVDGISDPVIEGSPKVMTPGNGVWDEDLRDWRAVRAGEALLGHRDETGDVAGHPDAAHLERDGSYLVVRKLEQDVAGFHAACAEWAAELPGVKPADVEAQLVGRHHDGRPLGAEQLGEHGNDFLFDDEDRARSTMPPSAHVRRANPRDGVPMARSIVPRHLLFRRAYRYAEAAAEGSPEGSPEREGLLFLACCADLRRQFEFVQAQWMQDGNRFGLGFERDPLVGTRRPPGCSPGPPDDAGQVSIAHDGARVRREMASFVTMRGGEYFLLPSRSALLLLGDPDGC